MDKEIEFKIIENKKINQEEKNNLFKKQIVTNPIYKKTLKFINRPIKDKLRLKDFLENVF